jgi:hypothetical protein
MEQNINTQKGRVWGATIIFFLASVFVIEIIPYLDQMVIRGTTPSLITFGGISLVLALFTMYYLKYVLQSFGLFSTKLLVTASIYNIFIIIIKFALSPLSLYTLDQSKAFTVGFFDIINGSGSFDLFFGLLPIGLILFLVYFAIFAILYKSHQHTSLRIISPSVNISPGTPSHRTRNILYGVIVIVIMLLFAYVFVSPIFNLFSGLLGVPLLGVLASLEYLSYIFSTIYGVLIALALIGAVIMANTSFKLVAQEAVQARNITLLGLFFFIGVVLILMYHVLAIIYMASITAIWHFSVYTPGD